MRSRCTRSKTEPRKLTLALCEEHQAIRARCQLQETGHWRRHYATRACVEGSVPHGLRRRGPR
ncbi:hypothetical protein ABZT06_45625 [Streptomyces sp. NPDC005483]|uniref:hypothetical protein n=1 Tax=Streptomyces sp. NPDC005483 TaxID=3154882 RepID=UPI0033B4DFC9